MASRTSPGKESSGDVSLSVLMPAYNEEGSIRDSVRDVEQFVFGLVPDAELVVVNDGSRDRTGVILDEMSAADSRVRVIHQQNGGHAAALMTGLSNSNADYIMLLDSDRQIPLDDFSIHWQLLMDGNDCVFGVRRRRHDPQLRLWLTNIIRYALQVLFKVRIYDANVPYKLLRRSVWEEASRLIPQDTLAPSLFLAIFAKKKNYSVHEIDVPHRERTTGEVSIRRLKLLKFCARGFMQMLDFRQRLRHA